MVATCCLSVNADGAPDWNESHVRLSITPGIAVLKLSVAKGSVQVSTPSGTLHAPHAEAPGASSRMLPMLSVSVSVGPKLPSIVNWIPA